MFPCNFCFVNLESNKNLSTISSYLYTSSKLLEFLTSEKAQKLYGEINFEYPANLKIEPGDELKSWGSFREDTLPIIKIAELAPEAQKIIDRVGW